MKVTQMRSNSHPALRSLSIFARRPQVRGSGGKNGVDENFKMKYLRFKKRNYNHQNASSDQLPYTYIVNTPIESYFYQRAKVIATSRQVEVVSSHSI